MLPEIAEEECPWWDQTPVDQRATHTPIQLCLFDLDQTLLATDELENLRGSRFIGVTDRDYTHALVEAYHRLNVRALYSQEMLFSLRRRFPGMQWGVLTRAPRHYARVLLKLAYPQLDWHCLVANENVGAGCTKPAGIGVWAAMQTCGIQNANEVILVGDDWVDIYCGYQAGCWTVLDRSSWMQPYAQQHYPAVALIPDADISCSSMLESCLMDPESCLPEIEYRQIGCDRERRELRLDRVMHLHRDRQKVLVTVMGRLFANYPQLRPRRDWHPLTEIIRSHKQAHVFPESWIQAIRAYLAQACRGADPIVTVIPFKPGRRQRMEALLEQVKRSDRNAPIRPGTQYDFVPSILAYSDVALSFHKHFLNADQRYDNARQSLSVTDPGRVSGREVIVFDDVVTTGASLLFAHRYLKQAGASKVCCMALTKTISRIRRQS